MNLMETQRTQTGEDSRIPQDASDMQAGPSSSPLPSENPPVKPVLCPLIYDLMLSSEEGWIYAVLINSCEESHTALVEMKDLTLRTGLRPGMARLALMMLHEKGLIRCEFVDEKWRLYVHKFHVRIVSLDHVAELAKSHSLDRREIANLIRIEARGLK